MTSPPPGTRLHRVLRRWAPAAVVCDILEPAIADLQYEAGQAPTPRARRAVIVRGHVAILRALILAIEPDALMRTALALSALCAVGILLLTAARAAQVDGRVTNSALLAPAMLTPLVLRTLGTTSSRRLFAGSLLVALCTLACADGQAWERGQSAWMPVGRAFLLLLVCAPIAAAAAIVAGPRRETAWQRAVTAVSLGSGIATAAFLVARWPPAQPLSIGLAMTPFYVALFAGLFGVTLLPPLLVARAFITRPALLALAGLVCAPGPLIAGAYLDHHTLAACLDALRRTPLAFAASSLPFVTGAIVVGWRLPPSVHPSRSSPLRS